MVLLKLSKFKLQLQALVSEVRELRERERSAYEQLQLSIQKQKQTEEEFNTKLMGLQAELALSNELGQKLEMKVRDLQSDNAMLENKQKELKGTINSLLQSRDSFLKSYEDSTCEMKRSIESRDRKISVLLEKINAHLLLIGSIEKEASSVKQVVDNVQHALNDKEEVVAGLKSKLDKVSTFEMLFVEKINNLESKLRNDEDDLGRKGKIIMELEAQMEAAKFTNKSHPQIEELQKIVSAKDLVIQNLISEKKALQFELGSLGVIIKKIQDTVIQMNEEDRRSFSSMLVGQEECEKNRDEENNRTEDVQNHREKSPHKGSGREATKNTASPLCQECNSISSPLMENNNLDNSCLSESACSLPRSACSEPESAANIPSGADTKDNCTALVHHLDSECSTTQADAS